MKSRLTKKPDNESEKEQKKTYEVDDEDDVEVDSGGPSISAAAKSKITIIAASSLLITVVVYLFFFNSEEKQPKNLEKVETPKAIQFAKNETGKSPFELPETPPVKVKDEIAQTPEKPAAPAVPDLPSLPESAVLPDQVLSSQEKETPTPKTEATKQDTTKEPVQDQAPTQNVSNTNLESSNKDLDPRYAPIIVFSGTATGTPSRGVGYENNIVMLTQTPIDALQTTKETITANVIKDRTQTIAQGKLLTAVLETAINTEIPGSVRAIVSRDVYGESGTNVLIPRGSRLYGSYSSKISQGQGRVEISWSRLIRPDGVDLSINFNASDQFGRAGISGDVDSRYGSIITNSILTSILAVSGVAAAQQVLANNSTTTTTTNPTQGTTTTTGSAVNQAIYDVSKTITDTVGQIIGNTLDVSPAIRVPQGTKITVIVNSDISIPAMK